jgi:hypothetical protein
MLWQKMSIKDATVPPHPTHLPTEFAVYNVRDFSAVLLHGNT